MNCEFATDTGSDVLVYSDRLAAGVIGLRGVLSIDGKHADR